MILQLTDFQVNMYLQYVRNWDRAELEYEEVPGAKEFLQKVVQKYEDAGMEVPKIEQ